MYMEKNLDITKPISSERSLIVSPLALRYIRVMRVVSVVSCNISKMFAEMVASLSACFASV